VEKEEGRHKGRGGPGKKGRRDATGERDREAVFERSEFRRPLSPWLSPSVAFSPSAQAFWSFSA